MNTWLAPASKKLGGGIGGRVCRALQVPNSSALLSNERGIRKGDHDLQPRLDTEIAFQRDSEFGVVRGVNDVEIGLRLRYEVRRELAPYFGVTFRQSFDATAPTRSTRKAVCGRNCRFAYHPKLLPQSRNAAFNVNAAPLY